MKLLRWVVDITKSGFPWRNHICNTRWFSLEIDLAFCSKAAYDSWALQEDGTELSYVYREKSMEKREAGAADPPLRPLAADGRSSKGLTSLREALH